MSDVKPLNATELAELKTDLAALQASIEALLSDTETGTRPVSLRENIGRLSRMDELHNQSILMANRNVLSNRLKQVRRAMKRIDEAGYGYCLECDESIAFPRLKAYPDAEHCIVCKTRHE
ncbi:MAG: TraR/DksA C4-type zinc finger protein [Proteobacteria bacterium]|nr:TraR/DksA C4-type zinc finger protein [Pseudomonadota bacterium]